MTETACILVCVTVQRECERLIRHGHAQAQAHHLPLHIIHVNTGKAYLGNPDAADALNHLYALARETDASMNILYSTEILPTIVQYAKEHNAKAVILGTDRSGFVQQLSMLLPLCQVLALPA